MIHELFSGAVEAAYNAGQVILGLVDRDVAVEYKEDRSPLTEADRASHCVIVAALEGMGPLPVLSEESRDVPQATRRSWRSFWLVDPLDGTKEFLKRNGEFTVNIALIESGRVVLGVVYAPVMKVLYTGAAGGGAFKAVEGVHYTTRGELLAGAADPGASWQPLPEAIPKAGDPVRAVASRSHGNEATTAFIAELESEYGAVELVSIGSSLKLCLVAEGRADVYPRIAPTMEWDTAAAQGVVEASGGCVIDHDSGHPLSYNKESLLNPHFVVYRRGWPERAGRSR